MSRLDILIVNIENGESLPSVEDNYTLRKDMIQVLSNILVKSLPSFKVFKTFILLTSSTFIPKKWQRNQQWYMVLLKASLFLVFFFQELNLFRFVIQLN